MQPRNKVGKTQTLKPKDSRAVGGGAGCSHDSISHVNTDANSKIDLGANQKNNASPSNRVYVRNFKTD